MNAGIETMLVTPSQEQQQQQQQQQTVAAAVAAAAAQEQQMDPLTQSTAETWLSIASLAETLGDADRAAMAYDATLQYNQSSTKALTSLAHLYRSRDMFQKAAELYERALAVNPELSDVWATLGHCYLMLDDLQRAYNAYQQALYHLSNPNVPKLWHGIGILYDRYGSLDYAEEAFAKVLELDPHFEKANEIYFRLGIIYKHQGKWNQALECFRYILAQPPAPLQEWDIWFQLGSVLENMGEWQGAREAYEHVLLQNEHHAKVLQQLGCLYGMNNVQFYDPQKALNFLLKSLEVDPSDATTWYHLGRVYMLRSDYTAAYDAFQQAVNRDSRNPIFWCSIGVLYYQISQYRDALDAYTRAIRLNPYISEVWYDLGTLYETCNNQLTDALDAYKQAARLDPENGHIRERLEALTQQLADSSHVMGKSNQSAGPDGANPQAGSQNLAQSSAPPPVMLQPTLQSTDQSNPLNVRPPAATLYASGPLGQQQQQAQQQAQQQQIPVHVLAQAQPQMPQYAMAVPQQSPLQMLPPPPQHQNHGQMKLLVNVQHDGSPYPQTQAIYHQPILHANQTGPVGSVESQSQGSPLLPQKRHMDGSIHTLVNAAVSSNANESETPASIASVSPSQVPTLPASQRNLTEPQHKKLKTKTSPKAAAAHLRIRSTTVKDKEKEKGKDKSTGSKQRKNSVSNGKEFKESNNGPKSKLSQEKKSVEANSLPELKKATTTDSAATITAPGSANASSVALAPEVPTAPEKSEVDGSCAVNDTAQPVLEPLNPTNGGPLVSMEAREAVNNATIEAAAESQDAGVESAPTLPPITSPERDVNQVDNEPSKIIDTPAEPPASNLDPSAPTTDNKIADDKVEERNEQPTEAVNNSVVPGSPKATPDAAVEDAQLAGKTNNEPETVIKPSAEAMEKLQEEARIREEEEKERLEAQSNNKPQSEPASIARENVVREIEEDEDYDD